ncbi:outer membrane lipoprotein chaperone LolA [Thiohalorhabdus methylotrophus]|uniref:Outer-membrane lipoprotein carrier protein n=1 Tax=Thiohalorhabdus methylotrophus TaxID=3242694 RepID=A0ABV4TY15_9GAMM
MAGGIGITSPSAHTRGIFRRAARTACLAGLLTTVPAAAAELSGLERLQRFYKETRALHADFTQRVLGPEGEVQERSQGQVWIDRPDHFRWDYSKPYPQKIIADGETVKFYDPEMEQVTIRDYSSGMGHTPSTVLAGGGDLRRQFRLENAGMSEDLAWVKLVPRNKEQAGFQSAKVGLAADPVRLRAFVFTDAFGNRTRLRFGNIRVNPSLEADLFKFQPPAGTDVLGGGRNE